MKEAIFTLSAMLMSVGVMFKIDSVGASTSVPPTAVTPAIPAEQSFAATKPQILFLGSNIQNITSRSTLDISAIVTSATGIDDVIGGVLLDPNGSSYGTLASANREGAYGIRLGWTQINAVAPIYASVIYSDRQGASAFSAE